MRFYLKTTAQSQREKSFETLLSNVNGMSVIANLSDATYTMNVGAGKRVYLFGDIFYHIKDNGSITMLGAGSEPYLKRLFASETLEQSIRRLEGQYIGVLVDSLKKTVTIFSDRYARLDCFYATKGQQIYFSSDLDHIFSQIKPEYDQAMLAHVFSVYGWYTPKGYTIYKNVQRLKVGEIVTISAHSMQTKTITFKPLPIRDYGEKDLETYYRYVREAIVARANHKGTTWVSSSSGWDSSLLLGMLVKEFGAKKVRMLAGSMKYSPKTGVINRFEMNKLKKIGEFYGVKPVVVDFDFRKKAAIDYWKRIITYFRSHHIYALTAFNFSRLSDGLSTHGGQGQVICNGELSDSLHNFGFSQFVTFFHTSKSFTEYADKMNCYLYGPSFFKKIANGTYMRDKVFQIFQKMLDTTEFQSEWASKKEMVESYLFPFFYGSPRVPFAKTYRNPLLTEKAQQWLLHFPFQAYMPEVTSSISEKNLYSWFIHLYHSFHSQGASVNVQKYAMERNHHSWRCPFNDYRVIDFLSQAPESWGRGLELNNTKFPLKWVARNKIKFPYELLQTGPHSYLYDVMEGFSLAAEITYRSAMTDFFKETLRLRSYRTILTGDYFDVAYLDKLVSDYCDGKQTGGQDFNNLFTLIVLSIVGWY